MGRIRGKRDIRVLKRRKSLIMTATYLAVVERGYANITIKDIADKAKISRALLFYYYDSKEEIVIETLKWVNDRIFSRIMKKIELYDNPLLKLKVRIEDSFLSVRENRMFYLFYLDFVHEGARNPKFGAPNLEFNNFAKEKSLQYIQEGILAGYFREDLDLFETSTMIKACIDGLLLQWLFDKPESFDRYKVWCKDIIFRFMLKDWKMIDEMKLLDDHAMIPGQ